MIIETNSARETFLLGRECARAARPGEVYCLQGDLGTGKTVFKAFQASKRTGVLNVEYAGDRVKLSGKAYIVCEFEIH